MHAGGLPAVFWKQYSDSVSRRLCFGSGVLPVCMQVACLLYFGSSIQGMIVVIICHLFSMSFVAVRTPVFGVNVIESGVAAWRGMDWMLVVIVLLFKLLSQFWCVGLCIAGVWNGVVLEWSWSPSTTSSRISSLLRRGSRVLLACGGCLQARGRLSRASPGLLEFVCLWRVSPGFCSSACGGCLQALSAVCFHTAQWSAIGWQSALDRHGGGAGPSFLTACS